MKIALVHELLTMRGGAERVLKILADMFPDAPIYTLLYNENKLGDWFSKGRVRTSIIQPNVQCSMFNVQCNHHLYLSQFPRAVESWDFRNFDLVISSSSAFAHGIITNGNPKHLCYVHSPARYLWDRTHDVLEQHTKGILGPIKKYYLSNIFHRLRIWDAESADRPDMLLAASKEVQRRIELYWRRESEVIYPPIEDYWLNTECRMKNVECRDYYLIVSTLVPYKRIECAIEACHELNVPLKIVGEGPHRKRLEGIANKTRKKDPPPLNTIHKGGVEFLGYKEHSELKELYANAKALILPGDEDFGLVSLEAMACGIPVIAYRKGGALETIIEGKTGVFFEDTKTLINTLKTFDHSIFDAEMCRERARSFSRAIFEDNINKAIAKLIRCDTLPTLCEKQ